MSKQKPMKPFTAYVLVNKNGAADKDYLWTKRSAEELCEEDYNRNHKHGPYRAVKVRITEVRDD